MPFTIEFKNIFKSITSFQSIDLPDFVVLTGKNGSGKSHFLKALNEGSLVSVNPAIPVEDIAFYDWNSIVPNDTGAFDPLTWRQQRNTISQRINTLRPNALKALSDLLTAHGIPGESCNSRTSLQSLLDADFFASVVPPGKDASHIYRTFRHQLTQHSNNIANQSRKSAEAPGLKTSIQKVQADHPELFLLGDEKDIFEHKSLLWGNVDPFRQAFGQLFTTYRSLMQQDAVRGRYGDQEGVKALSDEEFTENWGEPPWDYVNRILESNHLDFRIDKPPFDQFDNAYEPKLTKLASDIEMKFSDLSSGERVLMSFALCIYNSLETRQEKSFPKLLLFDEIDAPLHPDMTLQLINTIQKTLVHDRGVKVILTTHSPSTVAIAPESSLYCKEAEHGEIKKISQAAAISLLTYGLPTLSISFDGRRQVFVENKTDAQIYDHLFQRYRSLIDHERSLVFIEVGGKLPDGADHNTGCDQVKRLVGDLVNAGNVSVFGLVDWDGSRTQSERVHVSCFEKRDGIENLIFDPVLLVATLAHGNIEFCRANGILTADETFVGLSNWRFERWQSAADQLVALVLGDCSNEETVSVSYVNQMELTLPRSYLQMDDHALEKAVFEKLPCLIPLDRRPDGLMLHIVKTVLPEHSDLLPTDIIETFHNLVSCEVH